MTFEWLALVEFAQLVGAKLILIPVFFDRLSRDLTTIDEEASLLTFEQDAVVTSAGNVHFRATSKLRNDIEVM